MTPFNSIIKKSRDNESVHNILAVNARTFDKISNNGQIKPKEIVADPTLHGLSILEELFGIFVGSFEYTNGSIWILLTSYDPNQTRLQAFSFYVANNGTHYRVSLEFPGRLILRSL
jgi:hypothetical protein